MQLILFLRNRISKNSSAEGPRPYVSSVTKRLHFITVKIIIPFSYLILFLFNGGIKKFEFLFTYPFNKFDNVIMLL